MKFKFARLNINKNWCKNLGTYIWIFFKFENKNNINKYQENSAK